MGRANTDVEEIKKYQKWNRGFAYVRVGSYAYYPKWYYTSLSTNRFYQVMIRHKRQFSVIFYWPYIPIHALGFVKQMVYKSLLRADESKRGSVIWMLLLLLHTFASTFRQTSSMKLSNMTFSYTSCWRHYSSNTRHRIHFVFWSK
jgi:hypothetical protein